MTYDSDKDTAVNLTIDGKEINTGNNPSETAEVTDEDGSVEESDEDAQDGVDADSDKTSDEGSDSSDNDNSQISDEDKNVLDIDDVRHDKDEPDTPDVTDGEEGGTGISSDSGDKGISVTEDGEYTSKDEVALYIHTYNHLPSNYITKKEAQELGWDSSKGNLNKVAPGKSIGGDKFGNREGLLPKAEGRQYYECDIDYVKGSRNAKRIVFSNDGLVYYTEDHYETYELLYE
ncbi:MAG: ribonuclease [Lachnospiraceae bacterium]|nr:ribonuclease [Lachnospiraceae bacterium]